MGSDELTAPPSESAPARASVPIRHLPGIVSKPLRQPDNNSVLDADTENMPQPVTQHPFDTSHLGGWCFSRGGCSRFVSG